MKERRVFLYIRSQRLENAVILYCSSLYDVIISTGTLLFFLISFKTSIPVFLGKFISNNTKSILFSLNLVTPSSPSTAKIQLYFNSLRYSNIPFSYNFFIFNYQYVHKIYFLPFSYFISINIFNIFFYSKLI